jgi:hypothetical protein
LVIGFSFLPAGAAHRDDRKRLRAEGFEDHGKDIATEWADGLEASVSRGDDNGSSEEIGVEVGKVEATVLKVGSPLRFVPNDIYYSYTKNEAAVKKFEEC